MNGYRTVGTWAAGVVPYCHGWEVRDRAIAGAMVNADLVEEEARQAVAAVPL